MGFHHGPQQDVPTPRSAVLRSPAEGQSPSCLLLLWTSLRQQTCPELGAKPAPAQASVSSWVLGPCDGANSGLRAFGVTVASAVGKQAQGSPEPRESSSSGGHQLVPLSTAAPAPARLARVPAAGHQSAGSGPRGSPSQDPLPQGCLAPRLLGILALGGHSSLTSSPNQPPKSPWLVPPCPLIQ